MDSQNIAPTADAELTGCLECEKKISLIQRYEQLVSLYKKKTKRNISSSGISSQISNLKNNETINLCSNQLLGIVTLSRIIEQIVRKQLSGLFRMYIMNQQKKFGLMRIANLYKRQVMSWAFMQIRSNVQQPIHHQNMKSICVEQCNKTEVIEQTHKDEKTIKSCSKSQQINHELKIIKQQIFSDKKKHGHFSPRKIIKQNISLQLQNMILKSKKNYLRKQLDDYQKRLERESLKKKESLQILGADLREKDHEIRELKEELTIYQKKNNTSGNVLDSDDVSLRKQVQFLEKIQDKLNFEISKLKENLSKTQIKLGQALEEIQQKNKLIHEFQCKINSQQHTIKNIYIKQEGLKQLESLMMKKLKKLMILEERFNNSSILNQSELATKQFPLETKVEAIFNLIENISIKAHELRFPKLFDHREIQILLQHKEKYLKLEDQINEYIRQDFIKEKLNDSIAGRGKMPSEIFSQFQSSKDKDREKDQRSGITAKIIELEIEKSKLVSKISEMKEKLMHFRALILSLLKSLELQEGSIKQETESVLRVIFDIFEYSEQERESIMNKRKKFLRIF